MANKEAFLRFLAGKGSAPVLFEPFISRRHTETLIWRRGARLWNTPEHEISTLVSLTECTRADAVFVDLRGRDENGVREMLEVLGSTRAAFPSLCFGVMTDQSEHARLAEASADVLCAYGSASSSNLPVIRMDGTAADALARGESAWFAPSDAELHLARCGDRIRILGGLGTDSLGAPAEVYARVEKLASDARGRWAVGSGGEIGDEDYLGLIALLGAYGRVHGDF